MFFKNRCHITAVLVAGVLGISMVTGLTACGSSDGTKVVFTTGFGKNEVFRIGDESCSKAEIMIYLTTTQNQYENVYGTEIWNTSLNGVTLEDNVKETVLARIAQIKTMYLLAKEKEVTLDEAEEAKVVQAAKEYYSSLNDTEIEAMGATEEIVENLYREYAMADKVYIEPLTLETVKRIIEKEKPDSILPTLGGQAGLNLGMELDESGFLASHDVKLLGTTSQTIRKAEDRQEFKDTMEKIGEPCAPSLVVRNIEDGVAFAKKIGYPVVLRPAYSRSSSCTSSRALPTMRTPGFAAANRAVSAVS